MKILLVDVSSVFHRSYHALKKNNVVMTDSKGRPCVGTYGFFNSIFKVRADFFNFDKVVWAIDCFGSTETRKKICADYKATRKPQSDAFYEDLENLKQYLALTGVMPLGLKGYEADDIIASSMRYIIQEMASSMSNLEICIFSGDSDFELCTSYTDKVKFLKFSPLRIVEREEILQKWGVDSPEDIKLIKAISGDSSDNIAGIVTKKTALKRYKDSEFLKQHKEQIEKNLSLISFKDDLDVVPRSPDLSKENLEKIFTLMNSKSLLTRLSKNKLMTTT